MGVFYDPANVLSEPDLSKVLTTEVTKPWVWSIGRETPNESVAFLEQLWQYDCQLHDLATLVTEHENLEESMREAVRINGSKVRKLIDDPPQTQVKFECSECASWVPGDANFCPSCGTSFADDGYDCSYCGAEINIDASFCPSCGEAFQQ